MKAGLIFLFVLFISASNIFSQSGDSKSETVLKEGSKAPDFTLLDAYGKKYSLSEYKGKSPVVIYFYPMAGTSGCTKEACGIRDDWSKFEKNNIKVFGISTDDKPAIKKFIDDYSLNFPLLSDENKEVSKKYGVLKDDGRDKRFTFIVDKNGKIVKVMEVKDIASHSQDVFNTASKL
ncbi:MAG TPA: peroxiredoxin [Ignavibacteriaceae bacterium]|nr:peroxiredoxin [Ignavibacteriaceae bacterium]